MSMEMDHDQTRPEPPSRSSTGSSKKSRTSLTLDLSNIPPLVQPTPPSNTLIFTNLSADVFREDNQQTIHDLISSIAPIRSWAPMKSFRRIMVYFSDEDSAIAVRKIWDGEAILGERCRVYFGTPTLINQTEMNYLTLPDPGKILFISPPPSPPHDWETRAEDAPNKVVLAEDLAEVLSRVLRYQSGGIATPISPADSKLGDYNPSGQTRSRSSTLIFQPDEHGSSPNLPCIAVDDMTDDPEDLSPLADSAQSKPILAHTSRPPVELMHHT